VIAYKCWSQQEVQLYFNFVFVSYQKCACSFWYFGKLVVYLFMEVPKSLVRKKRKEYEQTWAE